MTPKQWATMNREWADEVSAVLAAAGLPWQAGSCWCEQRTAARCAELTHTSTGESRHITVSGEHAVSQASRKAEVVRQLHEPEPVRR